MLSLKEISEAIFATSSFFFYTGISLGIGLSLSFMPSPFLLVGIVFIVISIYLAQICRQRIKYLLNVTNQLLTKVYDAGYQVGKEHQRIVQHHLSIN